MEKIMELIELAMKINFEGEHDVFFEISPHVEQFSIRIFKNGWDDGNGMFLYSNGFYWDKEFEDSYIEIKEVLEGILNE